MAKAKTLVGLDVHATKIVATTLDPESGETSSRRLPGELGPTVRLLASLPAPVLAAYEAGPTGYGLARELERAGVDCVIAAPGKIPRGATDRVKTDRRDAEHLVRLLLAGKLHPVRVPGTAEEALRDLIRTREDVRQDLMRARHRLSKMLLRHGIRYEGRQWTLRHGEWLAKVELSEPAAQAALLDYRQAVELVLARRRELEGEIERRVVDSPWATQVARLRCLRGIDTLSAAGLCAEIGDFERFAKAGQLASYVGLVPSEHSTGSKRSLGSITKSGSRHARRLLVEAAWHYRNSPNIGKHLAARQEGQPAEAVRISWAAQRRLHRAWGRLKHRNKRHTVITVAVARQLAGFCWAIARID